MGNLFMGKCFAIREEVSLLLRKKAVELMKNLNVNINNKLPEWEGWISGPRSLCTASIAWKIA
jgi:hypothetical protein